MSFSSTFLLLALSASIVSGCGKKGSLYIPTAEQQAQMDKDQAERDTVLKNRAAEAEKHNTTPLKDK